MLAGSEKSQKSQKSCDFSDFCDSAMKSRRKPYVTYLPVTLFSIGLISIIWSCLVAASDADDRSEEYWRNKEIEKER